MARPALTAGPASYLPVREHDAVARRRLGVALEVHAQIGPAHTVAARHEAAERVAEAGLAAERDAPDAGLCGGRLGGADDRLERGCAAGGELQHAHFVARARLGERRRMPQRHAVEARTPA